MTLWLAGTEVGHFSLEIIESVSPEAQPGRIRESPEELRVRYPNMGTPWSAEDGKRLLALCRQGERSLGSLGKRFGRKPSAIGSRLAKLGLESLG
ncbi:hypothetical protein [Streptomyces sp. LN245]|uniref:hypothetical protein n=1 Tax=Streptomyces sp. LN245 TaxID=3112975 RepID=UPI003711CA71